MRCLQDELVQLVGVVCPHLALTLEIVLMLFQAIIMTGGNGRWWTKKKIIYRAPRARSVLINGRSACEEPPLRHLLRWAVELQWQRCFFFLLSSHFIHLLPILPSLSGCVLPYCVRKEGDPASLPRMVTPPQLVTSKRGHCSFCAPLLLNSPKEKLFA